MSGNAHKVHVAGFGEQTGPEHVSTIGIVSSEYHLYRAGLMARELGIDPIMIPAETTYLSLRVNYFLREIAAVWYYMIFGG